MPRITAGKRTELESFWRAHLDGWRRSDLNQREYCELHGLPLKRFGNWRATLKHEEPTSAGKLLYRRGGGLRHMSRHVSNKETASAQATYIPSASATPPNGRRQFSKADKKRILAEIDRPGGISHRRRQALWDLGALAVSVEARAGGITPDDLSAGDCHGESDAIWRAGG